jgi:sugar phosphate isomerase/epimerase
MKTIKGPGIFLAQFVGGEKPFNNLKNICEWASNLGYKAVQIPTWEEGLIYLKKAG